MRVRKLFIALPVALMLGILYFCNNSPPAASAQSSSISSSAQSQLSLIQLFSNTQESVVQVSSRDTSSSNPFEASLGSGFVYDRLGHVVTNYHVVSGQTSTVHVTFADGTVYNAKVVSSDPYSDISVLLVENTSNQAFVPLPLANSTSLVVGEPVAAIGNPFGLSGSLSQGIVSGLHRLIPAQAGPETGASNTSFSIPDIIQTDAAINPGISGGPLLDMQGEVIGMNTAIYSSTGAFQGVGFALPSNTLQKVVPVLLTNGTYSHPWLGLVGTDMTPELAQALGLKEPRGFLVTGTVPGSPAAICQLQGAQISPSLSNITGSAGDLILGIDGIKVAKIADLLSYLEGKKVGDTVQLHIMRSGQMVIVNVTLAARPTIESRAS